MSEYWKSTPKYWCKHCSTYVKDTPFERNQHESTAKHQINLKRFLRDIQNNHERGEREKERAKSEVERLKGVAGQDHTKSSSASNSSSKSTSAVQKSSSTAPPTEADRKRQWSQLAEMGIKVPEGYRSEMAMAGDWQVVSQQTLDEVPSEAPLSVGVKKRKYEGQEDDEEEKQIAGEAVVRRGWGAATKKYPGHSNADVDELLSGSIAVKKERPLPVSARSKCEEQDSKKQGNFPAPGQDGSGAKESSALEAGDSFETKTEKSNLVKDEAKSPGSPKSMLEVPEDVAMPVFKKRKAKAS